MSYNNSVTPHPCLGLSGNLGTGQQMSHTAPGPGFCQMGFFLGLDRTRGVSGHTHKRQWRLSRVGSQSHSVLQGGRIYRQIRIWQHWSHYQRLTGSSSNLLQLCGEGLNLLFVRFFALVGLFRGWMKQGLVKDTSSIEFYGLFEWNELQNGTSPLRIRADNQAWAMAGHSHGSSERFLGQHPCYPRKLSI